MKRALWLLLLVGALAVTAVPGNCAEYEREKLKSIAPGNAFAVSAVTMTSADTQYTLTIPAGTKQFTILNNSGAAFRLATTTGQVATPTGDYAAIPAGGSYFEANVDAKEAISVYCASSTAGTSLSLLYWY
jgi:hypothetical protein